MLFRADPLKDSPIGTSPLNNIYIAWRYKTELEKQEALGVATDVRGLKVIWMPPQYMSATATDEEKETYKHFQATLASMHAGEQSGVILPQVWDEGNKLFDFEVKSVMGNATHDVSAIISRYRKEIVTGILAPSLIIGQDGSGSFALAESLEGISATVVEARLVEMRDVLNHDLIKQLFQINGWDTEVLPYFDFEEVKRTNLDDWSAAVQRIASNGLIKLDANTINTVHSKLGLETAYDDENVTPEKIRENATNFDSSAGEGMTSATGVGTSKKATARDSSVSNQEN
jgi:phage gp29-like protein